MGDDERNTRIDSLLTELLAKITGWGESLSEFKCQMQRSCERRADACRADFEDLFVRMRIAETNISSVTTLVEVIKTLLADEKRAKPHWMHSIAVIAAVLVSLLAIILSVKTGGIH